MLVFLRTVGEVLPCKRCRRHYKSFVDKRLRSGTQSPQLADRQSLSRFVVDLHNDVNVRLGRRTMDFETVRHMYEVDAGWQCGGVGLIGAVVAMVAVIVSTIVMQRVLSTNRVRPRRYYLDVTR